MNKGFLTFLSVLFLSVPAHSQLQGTDSNPGDSCAGFAAGATRMNADAGQDGTQILLICDGSVWQKANDPASSVVWQDGGAGKIYYNGGNVGIGISAPSAPLTVQSAVAGTALRVDVQGINVANISHNGLSLNTDTGTASKTFFSASSGNANAGYIQGYMASNVNPKLTVKNGSNNGGAAIEFREFDETRSMLLGSTFPNGNLVASRDNLQIVFDADNDVAGVFEIAKGGGVSGWGGRIGSDGTSLLRITNGGNVGIGTTSPASKLDVNGKIAATAFGVTLQTVTNSITQLGGKNVSVSCPANHTVISGGCETVSYNGYLIANKPSGNGWTCTSYDNYPTAYSTIVYAICIKTQ